MQRLRKIIDYYDSAAERDANWLLSEFVLTHLDELHRLSLGDVARGAFVSKASVSRFVRKFGYEDYEAFLASIELLPKDTRTIWFRLRDDDNERLKNDSDAFFEAFVEDFCQALRDMRERVEISDVNSLVDLMLTHPLAILAEADPVELARELQLALLQCGRVTQVGTTEERRADIAASLEPGSVALVLSNYGNYVNKNIATLVDLHRRGVTLCLVTLCYSSPNVGIFGRVIRLSPREYSNVGILPMKVLVGYMVRRAIAMSGTSD